MPTQAWTLTREKLTARVLRKLGVIGAADVPEAEDAAIVHEAIDARLKEMHALGVLWWQVGGAATDLTLTAGVATVALPAGFLFPVSLALVSGDERPIDFISHREYQAIPSKSERGEPSAAFVVGSTVYLHPVPQTNYTARLTYQAIADDTAAGQPADIPASMLRSLSSLVAADLLDEFGISTAQAAPLMQQAAQAERIVRALNVERVSASPVAPEWY
jgi:hypothetical protein